MARAWGWEFRDAQGRLLPEGGGSLAALGYAQPGRNLDAQVTALADVRHVLAGPGGAIQFAAQKGAAPETARELDRGLARLAQVVPDGARSAQRPGAGAAGGLGFGLVAFANAQLVSGSRWLLERRGFDGLLGRARCVVVGEGWFDATSMGGKLTGEVLERAAAAGVPAVLVAPTVTASPPGQVVIQTGGGRWDATELARQVTAGVRQAASLSSS
jgi:glycerate kinase